MKLLAVVICAFLVNPGSQDGFYVVIKKESCSEKLISFEKRRFCLPDEPLLSLNDFNKVSKLKQAGDLIFFEVHLKPDKVTKIKKGLKVLSGFEFAVKLGNEIVGLFKFEDGADINKIRFYSYDGDQHIAEVYQEIEKLLKN